MDSRAGCARLARLVALLFGVLLAWPGGASAVTVTVGRQNLGSHPTTNFGCTVDPSSTCSQTVSPIGLTAGARSVVPGDGAITSWRAVGPVTGIVHTVTLRVLRPENGQYTFVSHSSDSFSPDGTPVAVAPALPVEAGDRLGVTTFAKGVLGGGASAAVYATGAMGAAYNLFSGIVDEGTTVSPTSMGQNLEPFFNADVVLDPPVVNSVTPSSGPTAGGQTVTIRGDHLTGVSQVRFGSLSASSFSAVSNTEVTAVTPVSASGPTDVIVETLGGKSVTSTADRYTFEGPNPPAAADFNGSPSSITVSRTRRFRFGFHATGGLTGTAVFKSLKRVSTSSTRRVTLARKSFTAPASGKVTLRIKLSKKKFRILKLNHKIRSRVTVTLKNAAGLTSTASKRITLKPPSRG